MVVEAAAGGTGSLAVQLAKRAGAKVIGLASSEEKRDARRAPGRRRHGRLAAEDLGAAIIEANGGEQVDVVLEMSGGRASRPSCGALAPFGRIVAFGIAAREPNEVATDHLLRRARSR